MGFSVAPWAIGDDEIFASLLYMYYDENIKFQNCEDLSLGDLSKIKKRGQLILSFSVKKPVNFIHVILMFCSVYFCSIKAVRLDQNFLDAYINLGNVLKEARIFDR